MVNRSFGMPAAIVMAKTTPYDYSATIPAEQVTTGTLTYRIIIQQQDNYIAFPGAHKGDPTKWDYINNDNWQTFVAAPQGKLSLFNANSDRETVNPYFPGFSRTGGPQFVSGEETGQLTFRVSTNNIRKNQEMGLQLYIGDKLKNRLPEVANYTKVVVRARMQSGGAGKLRIALLNNDASSYAAYVDLNDQYKNIEIPLSGFKPDSSLSVPRPYPGFLNLWFKASSFSGLNISKLDKMEITSGSNLNEDQYNKPYGIEVESVTLEP